MGLSFWSVGQSFNRGNFLAPGLRGQDETGIDRLSVHEHGACPAFTDAAPFLRTGQPEVFPQDLKKRGGGLDLKFIILAVYPYRYGLHIISS